MSDSADFPSSDQSGWQPPPIPDPPPETRFSLFSFILGLLAWCAIIALVIFIVTVDRGTEEKLGASAGKDNLNLLSMQMQARYLLGTRDLARLSQGGDEQQIVEQAKKLNAGSIDQRLRYVVLIGELEGPTSALTALDNLDQLIARNNATPTPEQQSQQDSLRRLYNDYRHLRNDGPSLSDADRTALRQNLGWFGDLALAPPGQPGKRDQVNAVAGVAVAAEIHDAIPDSLGREAVLRPGKRVLIFALSAVVVSILLLLLGFCGLIVLVVLWLLGKVHGSLECGLTPAGVYAETFALWIALFLGIGFVAGRLDLGNYRLLAVALGPLLSLTALGWPIMRGLSWRQVCEDIGWTLGRRPAAEPALGIGCYVMGLPLLAVAVVIVLILMGLQHLFSGGTPSPDDLTDPANPGHPIMGPLARGDWQLRLQLFFLASIVAPIVEETMFRGVLYRHLRELTRRLPTALGITIAALISSFIFAVIHPQGMLGVPVLMALACTFALTREWRGTLIPCMVAHGANNGFVLLVCIAVFGD